MLEHWLTKRLIITSEKQFKIFIQSLEHFCNSSYIFTLIYFSLIFFISLYCISFFFIRLCWKKKEETKCLSSLRRNVNLKLKRFIVKICLHMFVGVCVCVYGKCTQKRLSFKKLFVVVVYNYCYMSILIHAYSCDHINRTFFREFSVSIGRFLKNVVQSNITTKASNNKSKQLICLTNTIFFV